MGYSQTPISQTIRGVVVDQQSKHPIIGATIQLQNSEKAIGTTTDIDGKFRLPKVPIGRHTLIINYLGYAEVVLPNVLVNSGKEVVLDIAIKEQVTELEEVVVRANQKKPLNGMSSGSVRMLSMEELARFSGGFNDPARMAQNYAGVSGATDDRNDIIVRGNSPSAVLWRMEGIDIPSPNHWSVLGTTGGPVSMLNANNLSNSDFLSGAFPAEYSNAIAAVFDLKPRNGNTEKYEFLGQIGFNGFELGAEGPISIGRNASFVTNFRYSTLDVFNKLGIDFGTGSAIPRYKDATFKVNMPTKKSGTFSLWGIGGISDITFYDDEKNIYSQGSGQITSSSETGILGLTHLYFINKSTSSKIAFSISNTNSLSAASEIKNETEFEPNFSSRYRQTKYGLNWTINKKWNAKNRLKTGLRFDLYDLNTKDSVLLSTQDWVERTHFLGTTSLATAFVQWQHRFDNQLSMNMGVNHSFFLLNNSYALEPRFGLDYQLNTKHRFSFGYGRHSQLQPLPIYFSKDENASPAANQANEALDLMKSDHFVLAWNYSLPANLSLKLEAYYQKLSDLAVDPTPSSFSMINAGADFSLPKRVGLVNEGSGSNKGVELTIEKSLNKGYYFLLTGSIFDSKYKGSDGIQRNTFFNSNFVSNFLTGKEFRFNEQWLLTVDTKITYAGGRRYTPINLSESITQGKEVRDDTQEFEAQYAPYFRVDFKISMRNNRPKFSQIWSIDLTNLTGRRNEFDKSYSVQRQGIRTTYQRGFFPNILYQILF